MNPNGSVGRRMRATSSGFTILELLVVIFIMMAMTGIAVAAFRQFLDTERIKLAGGQVVSAVRMARQYAMSKRCKVMVEFVMPEYAGESSEAKLSWIDKCYICYADQNKVYGGTPVMKYRPGSGEDRKGVVKYDLSSIPANATVIGAQLRMTINVGATDAVVNVRKLNSDDWSSGAPAPPVSNGATWTSIMGIAGETLVAFQLWKDQDQVYATSLSDKFTNAVREAHEDDRTISFLLDPISGSQWYQHNVDSAELVVAYEVGTGETAESTAHLTRSVRIIPYMRARDVITGGFTWVLEQDSSALRIMDLPRNVIIELAPAREALEQYDPGDVDDRRKAVMKVYFNLNPDGTCTALAPDIEGWTDQVNTLILRDAVTNDVALLFVPPSSAFTRQRYLFGDEVDAFIAAHGLYSLW